MKKNDIGITNSKENQETTDIWLPHQIEVYKLEYAVQKTFGNIAVSFTHAPSSNRGNISLSFENDKVISALMLSNLREFLKSEYPYIVFKYFRTSETTDTTALLAVLNVDFNSFEQIAKQAKLWIELATSFDMVEFDIAL
jgi:hypothetical protein